METTAPPLRVFISYAAEDEVRKAEIVRFLHSSGDRYSIVGSQEARESSSMAMRKGSSGGNAGMLGDADVFLVLVSRAYIHSPAARIEIEMMAKLAMGRRLVTVIPFLLEGYELHGTPLEKFPAIPRTGIHASTAENPTDAYSEILHALQTADDLRMKPEAAQRIAKAKLNRRQATLDLSGFGLRRIPRDLLEMPWLTALNLAGNSIETIENLDELKELQRLSIAFNAVRDMSGVGSLDKLVELFLDENNISEIRGLEALSNLQSLRISGNQIKSLDGIQHLHKLENLFADRNAIEDVEALGNLSSLKCVVLTENQIQSLRPLLPQMKRGLRVDVEATVIEEPVPGIFLFRNPISDPPLEVVSFGSAAIIDHYEKVDVHGEKQLEVIKLILIGNSGVGKTNYSQFLRKQKMSHEHRSTDTLDILNLTMDVSVNGEKKPIRVNVFDFGGQDYYHDLHRLYYSFDTAYVLLWDKSSNRYSEQTEQFPDGTSLIYENFPLEYWLESIRYNLEGKQDSSRQAAKTKEAPVQKAANASQSAVADAATEVQVAVPTDLSITAPVLVLQNKIDLGAALLNQTSLHEKYPNIAAFFSVSLRTGKRLQVLDEVLHDCLEKLNLAGRTLVRYQHDILEEYLKSEVEFEVLSLDAFRDKCATMVPAHQQFFDLADARAIASILTNLGVVYYDQSVDGKETVFTQIRGLNEQIKKIMSVAKQEQGSEQGIVLWSQIEQIKHIESILPLLLKNYSILQLAEEKLMVPQFLPVKPDSRTEHFILAFKYCQIRYVYTAYFHKTLLVGVFARFLNRVDETPEDDSDAVRAVSYWRNGLVLSQGKGNKTGMVFVHFIKEQDTCRVEIRSLYPFGETGLEREVEKELDLINKGWTVRKEVSANSEDFFEVNALVAQAEDKDFVFRKRENVFTVADFRHLVAFKKVPKKLFISYSSKDSEYVARFWTHLDVLKTRGYIEPWYDRKIEPGAKWDDNIRREMESSDLVVFLLSPDFLATPYIMDVELKHAIEMAEQKKCELFFIQLRHCSWGNTMLRDYQMLLRGVQTGKRQSFIDKPDNDEGWLTYIESLTKKVRI